MAKKSKKHSSGGRKGFSLGSIGNILKTVLIGFGAAAAGTVVADRTNVNPMIPSAALGFIAAGLPGALAGLIVPFITRTLGTGGSQAAQVGQVVWA